MTKTKPAHKRLSRSLPLNIAVVGGGRACRLFLELLQADAFPYLDINVVGVCDIDPQAEGFVLARKMGIPTTDRYHDFFKLANLDGIIELTNSQQVLLDLIKLRPQRVGILEHNIGRFFRSYFVMTQRLKSAEYQAKLEKMASDFLIQQSNAAIVVLNTDFTIAEANPAYLEIVNRSKDEVIGNYCYEVYYGLKAPCSSSRPMLKCPMLETLQTDQSAHVIHEFPTSKGHTTYGDIVTYPLKNPEGEIFKIIEVWRDITEEISARWEKRTRALKADLNRMVQEDRMISLGKLVASCVHEINNPIQGLLTYSHLGRNILAQGNPTPQDLDNLLQYLTMMCAELERCGNIISGLLSFSRESPLVYKEVDVNDVLQSVIALTRHKMGLQNIELETDILPGSIIVRGDTNRLQQAMLNLIFNSIEAMPDGGRLLITSRLDEGKTHVLIDVTDSGHGIPAENLGHLFDPFFTTKEEGQGTGLGLSIVYGVIKNHGGKIGVNSTVGKGTTFSLEIPLL
jgi:signal transduction histidine kinase